MSAKLQSFSCKKSVQAFEGVYRELREKESTCMSSHDRSGASGSAVVASDHAKPATAVNRKLPQVVTVGKRRYLLQVLDYTAGKQSHVG